jgi:hypothetical protein
MDTDIKIQIYDKIIVSEKDYSISSEKYDDLEKSNEEKENENGTSNCN